MSMEVWNPSRFMAGVQRYSTGGGLANACRVKVQGLFGGFKH